MTTINTAADHGSSNDGADLPRPNMGFSEISCDIEANTALPQPVTSANVADSGRIRYGSCMRLPVVKDASTALPQPITSANVADSGRIRYGSCMRLPVAR